VHCTALVLPLIFKRPLCVRYCFELFPFLQKLQNWKPLFLQNHILTDEGSLDVTLKCVHAAFSLYSDNKVQWVNSYHSRSYHSPNSCYCNFCSFNYSNVLCICMICACNHLKLDIKTIKFHQNTFSHFAHRYTKVNIIP